VTKVFRKLAANEQHLGELLGPLMDRRFDARHLKSYPGQDALEQLLRSREPRNMTTLLSSNQYFQKEVFKVPSLRGKEFKTAAELAKHVELCCDIGRAAALCDPLDFFEIRQTPLLTARLDCLMNFSQEKFLCALLVPCYSDGSCRFDRGTTLADPNPKAPISLYSFVGQTSLRLDQADQENLVSILALLFEVEYHGERMDVESLGFSLMPVRSSSNHLLYGKFQLPIFKEALSKESLADLCKLNVWSIYGSLAKKKTRFARDPGCLVASIFPAELEGFCNSAETDQLLSAVFMGPHLPENNEHSASNLARLRASPKRVQQLIPDQHSSVSLVDTVIKRYCANLFEGREEDSLSAGRPPSQQHTDQHSQAN